MKTSELIKHLQQMKREHGDQDVEMGNPDEGLVMSITGVTHIKDFGDEWVQLFGNVGPYCRNCGRGCD